MFYIFLSLIESTGIMLYNNSVLNKFSRYCRPNYSYITDSNSLTKVITIFRHGNRSPLRFNNRWNERHCMKCNTDDCTMYKCQNGDLSIKGYEQGNELGKFIKNNYLSKFNKNIKIHGMHTGVNRTVAMLKAVVKGMEEDHETLNVSYEENASILDTNNCQAAKKAMLSPMKMADVDIPKFDITMASICNDVKYDCTGVGCDYSKIQEFLENINFQFEDKMSEFRENIVINGMSFSYLAQLLEEISGSADPVTLISAHDSTLNRILNGLNISNSKIPAYASAIFIEFYKKPSGQEFIKINYDGKIVRFGYYKEKHVEKAEFMKYLKTFSKRNKKIENICSKIIDNDSSTVITAKNQLSDLFKPLLKSLSTKKIGTLPKLPVKTPNASAALNTVSKNLKKLVLPDRSNLFFGLFGGTKSTAKCDETTELDVVQPQPKKEVKKEVKKEEKPKKVIKPEDYPKYKEIKTCEKGSKCNNSSSCNSNNSNGCSSCSNNNNGCSSCSSNNSSCNNNNNGCSSCNKNNCSLESSFPTSDDIIKIEKLSNCNNLDSCSTASPIDDCMVKSLKFTPNPSPCSLPLTSLSPCNINSASPLPKLPSTKSCRPKVNVDQIMKQMYG
ncbi:pxylp1 [Nucleospora cyclopteri]